MHPDQLQWQGIGQASKVGTKPNADDVRKQHVRVEQRAAGYWSEQHCVVLLLLLQAQECTATVV